MGGASENQTSDVARPKEASTGLAEMLEAVTWGENSHPIQSSVYGITQKRRTQR